jgi:predicted phosphohydrolase
MTMTIQYASDLHLEFPLNNKFIRENPLQPKGDILVLAGDIVPFVMMDQYDDFFNYLSDNFQATYWVPGNHEYYYDDISARSSTLNEKIRSNVYLVNNVIVKHDNVKLIFSTLWSRIGPGKLWEIQRGMSDFRVIKYGNEKFNPDHFNALHTECLEFIKREIEGIDKEDKVVVSHHIPTYLHYPEIYKGSPLSEAFAVELHDMIEASSITSWIYGHHHSNLPDFKIGNTLMCTNQLGYVKYNEHYGFDGARVLIF